MRQLIVMVGALLIWAPAAAQSVYPSAHSVPANLLRISIAFPSPPAAEQTPRIWLSDCTGSERAGAFYPQRLWSSDGRTLTLYLDPGRVKTGLRLKAEYGAILRAGENVQLRLGDRVLKTWSVAPANLGIIEPRLSALKPVPAATRTPVVLTFMQPIDKLGRDLIAIQAPDGERVNGIASLSDDETTWTFTPSQAWRPGRYVLRLNAELEDPEGNRLGSSFETPIGGSLELSEVRAPFSVQ